MVRLTLLGAIIAGAGSTTPPSPSFNPYTDPGWYACYTANNGTLAALGDAGNLVTWPDESGNGRTLNLLTGTPTWDASNATFNNKPVVNFSTSAIGIAPSGFGTLAQPDSIVVVGRFTVGDASLRELVDSRNATNRQRVGRTSGPSWKINAGTNITGSASDTNKHLFVGYFNGASSALEVDGTVDSTGDAGANSLGGLTIAGNSGGTAYVETYDIAFVAVYSGDARAQSWWSDFEAWVSSEYTITIS